MSVGRLHPAPPAHASRTPDPAGEAGGHGSGRRSHIQPGRGHRPAGVMTQAGERC